MNLVAIGKIFSTFGLDGSVKIYAYADQETLQKFVNHEVWIGQNSKKSFKMTVESITKMNNYYIAKLSSVGTIDKARRISGNLIYVNESDLPVLEKDEYYFYQVIDSEVYYENGDLLGKVVDIIQTGSNDVLIVGNEEILIPIIKDYVIEMDLKARKIVVRKMEWF